MQPQRSLADAEDDGTKRQTRRAQFLQQMDAPMPWQRLEQRIRPFDPTAGRGRPPYPLSVMRRIHGVQLGYDRSDPAMEDARDDRLAVQRVVGMSLREPLPDETTILNFRHLLERHGRGEALLAEITEHLAARGVRLRAGTIVDATIIDDEPPARDPAPQSRVGRDEAHIGVDAHTEWCTASQAADVTQVPAMLHGAETRVWGTRGIGVARRPGATRRPWTGRWPLRRGATAAERRTAVIRALVEHPFLYVKRHFGYAQLRYRGLAKNRNRLCLWLGLANLWLAERQATA